jgi:adenine-specific DNA-methyltransferase
MSRSYPRLNALLKELFQLDQPDLDFGFYRVMHARSAEVSQFLEKDLLPQVQAAFIEYKTADKAEIEKELVKVIAGIEAAGMDPSQSPKVKDLRERMKSEAVDLGALESEVYDHLFSFFRRYYTEGDFVAKRVYRPGVYAIPYEGEEVSLYWANKDQYYIKTGEYLRDYAFRLRPDDHKNPMRVHFRLTHVAEGEHGNVKAPDGKGRVFILAAPASLGLHFIAEEDGESGKELVVRFEYRPATLSDWPEDARAGKSKAPAQRDLNALTVRRLLAVTDEALVPWIAELGRPHITADGEKADYCRLDAQLKRYTARNTFDYFIHKDLDAFLRRELDFYIKNEIMHLDDVENESAPRVEQYLSKIKVFRKIAGKLIDFLAQLENFQRKMWLKQKFVLETSYLLAISVIPEKFYEHILTNKAQIDEWIRLHAIDESTTDSEFTDPLTIEFLKSHPTLLVDTRHLDAKLTYQIVETISELDESTDAVLVEGDNAHALRLLGKKYRNKVKCAYIDPPYNTGGDGFMYRDDYRHSSWLTMIFERLELLRSWLADDAVLFASIDANERAHLEASLVEIFGARNRVEELIWVQNTTKNQSPTYSTNHEYVEVFAKDLKLAKAEFRRFRERKPGLDQLQALLDAINPTYPPVSEIEEKIQDLYKAHQQKIRGGVDNSTPGDDWKGLLNYSHAEYRDADGRLVDESTAKECAAKIWVWRESDTSMPQVKEDSQKPEFRDPSHPTYRFYKPRHPTTGRECPAPKRGWAWPYLPHGRQSSCFSDLAKDDRIVWGPDESKVPQTKTFVHEVETNVAKSVVIDFTDGEKQLANLFGRTRAFSNPKPSTLLQRFVEQTAWSTNTVVDCFAGSGTLGHAVIDANRNDGGRRRFLLVEPGGHFESVLVPRIKKVTYASEWKNGKPKRAAKKEEIERSPRMIKILRLESYDEALNNLAINRTEQQQLVLDAIDAQGADRLKEEYILRYMLNVETRGSQSLLNVEEFTDPTAYKLRAKRAGSDETREIRLDLLETFNCLLGLSVAHIAAPQTFSAVFKRDNETRLCLARRLNLDESGPYWFRTVTGTTPDGRRTLVIWRKRTEEPEQDNLVLDEWFTKQGYSSKDNEFDIIYVNGGNNLENLRTYDDTWKVRMIEEDFHGLMFEMEGA